MRPAALLLILLTIGPPAGPALAADGEAAAVQPARTCYSASETREKIASAKLAEPFPLMRAQAAEHRAEAIGVKLCRVPAGLVYEIDLLRRDGRLIHTKLDAATGKPVAGDSRK